MNPEALPRFAGGLSQLSRKTWNSLLRAFDRRPLLLVLCPVVLGIVLYWLPSLGIPVQSDTVWIFRVAATDPEDPRIAGRTPVLALASDVVAGPPIRSAVEIARTSGRYNFAGYVLFWWEARAFGANADLWRLTGILFTGIGVGIFLLVLRRIGIGWPIVLIAGSGLVFYPSDIWLVYNKSETYALPFFAAAMWLAVTKPNLRGALTSAGLMVVAVTVKESFVTAWPLLPALGLWAAFKDRRSRPGVWHATTVLAGPHLLGAGTILVVFALLTMAVPANLEYGTAGGNGVGGPFPFLFRGLSSILPPVAGAGWPFAVIALLVVLRSDLSDLLAGRVKNLGGILLVAVALFCVLAHLAVYYLLEREVSQRYVAPANICALLALAVLASRAVLRFGRLRRKDAILVLTLAALAVMFAAPPVSVAIGLVTFCASLAVFLGARRSIRRLGGATGVAAAGLLIVYFATQSDLLVHTVAANRSDQRAWQALNDELLASPHGAFVEVHVDDPLMIETVASLEANLVLAGRGDLAIGLVVDQAALERATDFQRRVVDPVVSRPRPEGRPVAVVDADRNGGGAQGLAAQWALLRKDPLGFVLNRYGTNQAPYLNYSISWDQG